MKAMTAIKSDQATEAERLLDWHLKNWAAWMRSADVGLGHPHTACGCRGGGVVGDFDDMVRASDRACAIAMNAVIEDLSPVESAAIFHVHLYSVYRFPRVSLSVALFRARENLVTGMKRKGLWWGG